MAWLRGKRARGKGGAWPVLACVLMAHAPASAQPPAASPLPADSHLAEMLEAERDLAHVAPGASPDCPAADAFQPGQQITVCARHTDTSRYRVPSSNEERPTAPEALKDGQLHAPNVDGTPPCLAACVTMRFGYAPPPVYYLDTTKLPEPAPGTDAWKIAHGEASAP